jgi:cyclic pyranopterin monophosphate synthase|uniref:cyclic pyranopterin monophosphate synthase MoaC n=1 Tax=Candidatus Planktophila sp. TaxID=2175601 RepID=UPI00404A89A2
MSEKLSHINDDGNAHMVDVSDRAITQRSAHASGKVVLSKSVLSLIAEGKTPKGDILATARIAGIMGAKKTPELIPLCHPISISSVNVDLEIIEDGVKIYSTVTISDRTGVEMEALTAVSIAALTIIDMTKALDPGATITNVQVDEKDGGRNGHWKRT